MSSSKPQQGAEKAARDLFAAKLMELTMFAHQIGVDKQTAANYLEGAAQSMREQS